MTDVQLLSFGAAVAFIAASGAYVYLRSLLTGGEAREEPAPQRLERTAG